MTETAVAHDRRVQALKAALTAHANEQSAYMQDAQYKAWVNNMAEVLAYTTTDMASAAFQRIADHREKLLRLYGGTPTQPLSAVTVMREIESHLLVVHGEHWNISHPNDCRESPEWPHNCQYHREVTRYLGQHEFLPDGRYFIKLDDGGITFERYE